MKYGIIVEADVSASFDVSDCSGTIIINGNSYPVKYVGNNRFSSGFIDLTGQKTANISKGIANVPTAKNGSVSVTINIYAVSDTYIPGYFDSKIGNYYGKTVYTIVKSYNGYIPAGNYPISINKTVDFSNLLSGIIYIHLDDSLIKSVIKSDCFYKNNCKDDYENNNNNYVMYKLYIYCNKQFINEYGEVNLIAVDDKGRRLGINYTNGLLMINVYNDTSSVIIRPFI